MTALNEILSTLSSWAWGPWLLVLLLGTGMLLTWRLRCIQFRHLWYGLRLTFTKERDGEGDVSHFGALMTALAATVGVGNIAGVSTAVALGGPGAVFWMWVTALFGMATKFSEGYLALRYRVKNSEGQFSGGPMYYLELGLGQKWLGTCFALFGAFAAFGIGNMVQSNTTAQAVEEVFGINPIFVGVILAVLTGMVILGGIRRIAEVTSFLVPVMVVIYFLGAMVVILTHFTSLWSGFTTLVQHAFTGTAATGGFAGAALSQTIRFGVARGMFSNESGLGSAPIAAAAAKTNHPAKQALVSMTGTFLDTLVICSFTGIILATTQVWVGGKTGVALTIQAFATSFPGQWGQWIVTLGVITFAFSTILGWSYYGEKCVEYLAGSRFVTHYRYIWVSFVFVGAVAKLEVVWNISDVMNALMAVPNLIALLGMNRLIAREMQDFEKELEAGTVNRYD